MDDIYKNIEECNPKEKRKVLIIYDYMLADMLNISAKHFSCFYQTILFCCTKKY